MFEGNMRSKLRTFAFGIAVSLLPIGQAAAQEIVMVNGVEDTRVIIGPAISPCAKTIKKELGGASCRGRGCVTAVD